METALVALEEQINALKGLSADEINSFIYRVQDELLRLPQVDLPVGHHFATGTYGRQMEIPKGTMVVGHVHKTDNINILLKGELTVVSQDGIVRIKAPFIYTASAGVKKLAYAHEDSSWLNILPTDEKDPEVIKSLFIVSEIESLETNEVKPCLSL